MKATLACTNLPRSPSERRLMPLLRSLGDFGFAVPINISLLWSLNDDADWNGDMRYPTRTERDIHVASI